MVERQLFQPVPETVHVELRCNEHNSAVEIGIHAELGLIGLAFRDFLILHGTCRVTGRTWDEMKLWPCPPPKTEDTRPIESALVEALEALLEDMNESPLSGALTSVHKARSALARARGEAK